MVLTQYITQASSPSAVRLAWATASEVSSRAFEVERNLDGRTFAALKMVVAACISNALRCYMLRDVQLPTGVVYYRLRQVDANGTFNYSPGRAVTLASAGVGLSLFSSPAYGGVATLAGALPGTVLTVTNALGRPVTSATVDAAGTAALALPAGVYVGRAGSKAIRFTVE